MMNNVQRQFIIDELRREANNGIWQNWQDKSEAIFCIRDMCFPDSMGRLKGIITVLKSFGDVSIEPHDEEGYDSSLVKFIITPRKNDYPSDSQ